MFENVINPSWEGRWTRLSPYLTLLAVAVAFCLALAVVVAAVQTSQLLVAIPPDAAAVAEQPLVLVKKAFAR